MEKSIKRYTECNLSFSNAIQKNIIREVLKMDKVVLYSTPNGNLVICKEEKYNRLKNYDGTI